MTQGGAVCFTCGRDVVYLINWCCDQCDPAAHRARAQQQAMNEVIDLRYLLETGRTPLADWAAFEAWCTRNGVSLLD